jgi:hypothetical protein
MIIGPGPYADEIIAFLDAYPEIALIHILDYDDSDYVAIRSGLIQQGRQKDIARLRFYYDREGGRIPGVDMKKPFGEFSEEIRALAGRADLIYDANVFGPGWFSAAQLKTVAGNIAKFLKPGGIHISYGMGHGLDDEAFRDIPGIERYEDSIFTENQRKTLDVRVKLGVEQPAPAAPAPLQNNGASGQGFVTGPAPSQTGPAEGPATPRPQEAPSEPTQVEGLATQEDIAVSLGEAQGIPLEERVRDFDQRLRAKQEKGTRWLRINATPQEAYDFHRNWSSWTPGYYRAQYAGNTYIMPIWAWDKMATWSNLSEDLERTGYFVARKIDNNTYEILDFIPLGSLAEDYVALVDPFLTQTHEADFERVGIYRDVAQNLHALGHKYVDLNVQDKLLAETENYQDDIVTFHFHSHHNYAYYSSSPSTGDFKATVMARFVYCNPSDKVGRGRTFIYDHAGYIEIGPNEISSGRQGNTPNGAPALPTSPLPPKQGKEPGGIDFRALPVVTQPLGTVPLVKSQIPISKSQIANLEKEWQQIERMLQAGIRPSTDRIKEYVKAIERQYNSETPRPIGGPGVPPSAEIDKVLSCIADILRQEEEVCCPTEPALRQLLVLLESGDPLGPGLERVQPLPKEPKALKQ